VGNAYIEFNENTNGNILLVGGGGSGGYFSNVSTLSGAGGGGGGGTYYNTIQLNKNTPYVIQVGNGGLVVNSSQIIPGGNSMFNGIKGNDITATGGSQQNTNKGGVGGGSNGFNGGNGGEQSIYVGNDGSGNTLLQINDFSFSVGNGGGGGGGYPDGIGQNGGNGGNGGTGGQANGSTGGGGGGGGIYGRNGGSIEVCYGGDGGYIPFSRTTTTFSYGNGGGGCGGVDITELKISGNGSCGVVVLYFLTP
jgi:hypothetical protein